MGGSKIEPQYRANQLTAWVVVALGHGIVFGCLLSTGPCKPTPRYDADCMLNRIATYGVERAVLEGQYGYPDTVSGNGTHDCSIVRSDWIELDCAGKTLRCLLLEHEPPLVERNGGIDHVVDVFLFAMSGPVNVFHEEFERLGSQIDIAIVHLPGPHLAISQIAGRGRFMDLAVHKWIAGGQCFQEVFQSDSFSQADIMLSDNAIRFSSDGMHYELVEIHGRLQPLPSVSKPLPFDSGNGICHVLDIWNQTWDDTQIDFATNRTDQAICLQSTLITISSNDWIVIQDQPDISQHTNGVIEPGYPIPVRLWVKGSVELHPGVPTRLLPTTSGSATIEHWTTSAKGEEQRLYRIEIN